MDYDHFLRHIGGCSWYQIQAIITGVWMMFVAASINHLSILLSAIPQHRCRLQYEEELLRCNSTEVWKRFLTVDDEGETSSCRMLDVEMFNETSKELLCHFNTTSSRDVPCMHGWVYSEQYYKQTTITEWDLICSRQILDSVANSLYFFGCTIGAAIQGPMSDWFGRKRLIIIFTWCLVLTNLGATFAHEYWLYVVLRVFVGLSNNGCILSGHTYLFEIVDAKTREVTVPVTGLMASLAHTVVPLLAYAFRHWRWLNGFYSVFLAPCMILSFLIPDSPRWLLANGREADAKNVLESIAASNKVPFDEKAWDRFKEYYNNLISEEGKKKRHTTLDLFRRRLTGCMTIIIANAWFVVNLVFFGLILNGSNLLGDPYLNTTLNGAVELVASLMFFFLYRIDARRTGAASYLLAGSFCLLSVLQGVENWGTVGVVMAILGKMFSTLSLKIMYFLTLELYPVKIRSTALSLGSTMARIAGMITPFVLYAQFTILWLTSVIFGVLSIVTGFTFLLLPGGRDQLKNPTLEEAEEYYEKEMRVCARILRSRKGNMNEAVYLNHGFQNQQSEGQIIMKELPIPGEYSHNTKL